MQLNRYRMHNGRLPFMPLFWAGMLLGIITMNLGKSILLENTGLLDEYTLYHMKYMTVDSSALFYYVLGLRMKNFLLLAVLATTYLGMAVCVGTTLWYGFSVGAFLAALMIRYSLKGIIFAILSIFPQGIFYIPAMAILLLWCEQLNRGIYFKNGFAEEEGELAFGRKILQLVLILGIMLLGCLAESFVNPGIMSWLLKYF